MRRARPTEAGTSALEPRRHSTPPLVSGQTAQVLEIIRSQGPIKSLVMTGDYSIPQAAARVFDLRALGFNILTEIAPEVMFRGVIRRKIALYSMGVPAWPAPGFFPEPEGARHG